MEHELKFKNYKEKQAYYNQQSKQTKTFWFSKEPTNDRKKRVGLIKGRTYIKKENENVRDDTK